MPQHRPWVIRMECSLSRRWRLRARWRSRPAALTRPAWPRLLPRWKSRWRPFNKRMCRFIVSGSARWTAWSTRTSRRRCPATSSSRPIPRALSSRRASCCFRSTPAPFRRRWTRRKASSRRREGQLEQARAQLAQAEAQVAVAEANQRRTQLDVDRYTPLGAAAGDHAAGSRQRDAEQHGGQGAACRRPGRRWRPPRRRSSPPSAAVQSAKASVRRAQINLGFTRLTFAYRRHSGNRAAAGGRAGEPGQRRDHHRLDARSDQGLLHGQRAGVSGFHAPLSDGRETPGRPRDSCELELILADGTVYPHKGKFYFADRQVDVRTGAIRLAALFPNPGQQLAARPVRKSTRRDASAAGSAAGSAARGDRPAGHASGRRRRQRATR